jgi:hypothetical protein
VQNSSANGDSRFPGGVGANTIEFNSTLTIEQGANVFADGTASNTEAVTPAGSGTIINHGTVRSTHAAIWFQANSGNTPSSTPARWKRAMWREQQSAHRDDVRR